MYALQFAEELPLPRSKFHMILHMSLSSFVVHYMYDFVCCGFHFKAK